MSITISGPVTNSYQTNTELLNDRELGSVKVEVTEWSFKTSVRNFYRPQRSCGKVMFSQASVILFTGRRGVAETPRADTPPRPVHAWINTPPAQCMLGYTPPPTATAADGTHPTGMHSCWHCDLVCFCGTMIRTWLVDLRQSYNIDSFQVLSEPTIYCVYILTQSI